VFLIHDYTSKIKIKFIRNLANKFVLSMLASFVYITVLKEGAAEHARRKTEMSRMRSGVGAGREQSTGEVREVRVSNQGVQAVSPLVSASSERLETERTTEEEN
jgi:hypothetical protein